jgi:uncharacterized repeat protein (TIGR03987 family)
MSLILTIAVIVTILALIFYSLATWNVFRSTSKNKIQQVTYWIGFACDLSGSIGMAIIAGGMHFNQHSIFGYTALLLMMVICLWLTHLPENANFKLFKTSSLVAWVIWVGSFISGMIRGMQ